eukprot:1339400-Rhodomonas_salina.2
MTGQVCSTFAGWTLTIELILPDRVDSSCQNALRHISPNTSTLARDGRRSEQEQREGATVRGRVSGD